MSSAESRPALVPAGPVLTDMRSRCIIPLGEEFICLLQIRKVEKRDSRSEPSYLTHMCIGRLHPKSSEPFILEILSSAEEDSRSVPAKCTIQVVLSDHEANGFLRTIEKSQQVKGGEILVYNGPTPLPVRNVNETLRRLLPDTLQESGSLLLTSQFKLEQLQDVHDYPLARLAFVIRQTANVQNWDTVDITALLRQSEAAVRDLTQDEVERIAGGQLLRLLEYLPDAGQHEPPDTLNDSQQEQWSEVGEWRRKLSAAYHRR